MGEGTTADLLARESWGRFLRRGHLSWSLKGEKEGAEAWLGLKSMRWLVLDLGPAQCSWNMEVRGGRKKRGVFAEGGRPSTSQQRCLDSLSLTNFN